MQKTYIFDFCLASNFNESACGAASVSEHEVVVFELDFSMES
jgi:hypothetical protein